MEEIWKDVVGYEGLYQISNIGRLRTVTRPIHYSRGIRIKKGFVKKNLLSTTGYYTTYLVKDGKRHVKQIHRLVAEAFIPNPKNYPIINHKDENPLNNCVDNLEWCTQYYNVHYGTGLLRNGLARRKKILQYDRDGNFIKMFNGRCEAIKEIGKEIDLYNPLHSGGFIWREYDGGEIPLKIDVLKRPRLHYVPILQIKDDVVVAEYESIADAARALGITRSSITSVLRGRSKSALGFSWKYKNEDSFVATEKKKKFYQQMQKRVVQLDIEGNFIAEYKSRREASEQTNIHRCSISNCCNGIIKQVKGYIFKYRNEYIEEEIDKERTI